MITGAETVVPVYGIVAGIIISLGFFAMIVLSLYFYYRARNRERMVLIEKGADLSKFYKKPNGHQSLKNGMFLMGIAVGLVMAHCLTLIISIPGVVAYFSMIFLFGGLGLILYYPISSKYVKKDADGE